MPLDRLLEIGRADLDRNLVALDEACKEFAPDTDRVGCMAKMNANRPEGGAVEAARKQLDVLRTIPGRAGPRDDSRPTSRRWWTRPRPTRRPNFAYIMTAGPYDVGMPSTYYIAPPDPSWPQEEQDAYTPGVADLMSTSVHEVWPGHFLQFLHSNRSKSAIGKLFVGYAFAEGWAHYAEEMMCGSGAHRRSRRRERGVPRRPDQQGALSQCPVHLRDRHAHRGHDGRGLRNAVPRAGVPGSGQRPPAGGARHIRSGLSQLHARQADDPQAARRLDANHAAAARAGRNSTTRSCRSAGRRCR